MDSDRGGLTEPVRIALIGAGRMGRVHLAALTSSDEVALAGVVEPVAATRERLAGDGVTVYASVDELLAGEAPEGVLIAAPSDQHPELVSRFAAAGIPILCEKPVGITAQGAEAVARTVDDSGVLMQVGYWRRFVPALQGLRERIITGALGTISQLACMQWDTELPSEGFRAHSGGIAVDMGVHEFDQTRWLLGQEFAWLTAIAAGPSAADRPPADPDCATILAELSGGTAVTISLGRCFPNADSCWLEVWGTEGYERVPFMWDTSGDEVFLDAMRRQAEAFARAVRGADRAGAGADDAVAALTVAGCAAQALREHAPVVVAS